MVVFHVILREVKSLAEEPKEEEEEKKEEEQEE